jgi:drug/metabolite transporter (DMT)-like permease
MRDSKLVILVVLATILSLAHTVDHIARGDLQWPLTPGSVAFILVSLAVYVILGGGLYLYLKGRVGPRYWATVAALGIAALWLGHFSPFTDQPAQYIFNAYQSVPARWLAFGCVIALMAVLIAGLVYASYLWARGLHEARRAS